MNAAPHMTLLDWDTVFFGFPTGRLHGAALSAARLREQLAAARNRGWRLLYWFVAPDDTVSLATAQAMGLSVADDKLIYTCATGPAPARPAAVGRVVLPQATPALVDLALQSGAYSRFRLDVNFAPAAFERLYTAWLQNALTTPGQQVFTYNSTPEAAPTGLLTLEATATEIRIGLLSVAVQSRQQGIGRQLVAAAQWEARQAGFAALHVATQGTNEAACRLYEQAGFVLRERQFVFHLWLGAAE